MKIDFIKLKNFSNIYTVYNSREVSIDFRNFKNKIILVVTHGYVAKSLYLTLLKDGISTNGLGEDLFGNAEVKKVII